MFFCGLFVLEWLIPPPPLFLFPPPSSRHNSACSRPSRTSWSSGHGSCRPTSAGSRRSSRRSRSSSAWSKTPAYRCVTTGRDRVKHPLCVGRLGKLKLFQSPGYLDTWKVAHLNFRGMMPSKSLLSNLCQERFKSSLKDGKEGIPQP